MHEQLESKRLSRLCRRLLKQFAGDAEEGYIGTAVWSPSKGSVWGLLPQETSDLLHEIAVEISKDDL